MAYKVYFLTLGCKVNSYESAAIGKLLMSEGFEETQDASECDVYIINTCAVTAEADRKSRQMIRKARRVAPKAVVVAMGCHTEMKKDESDADITVGTSDRPKLVPLLLEKLSLSEAKELADDDYDAGTKFYEYGAVLSQEGTRAVVKIEDGCNNFCTYCIIPYSRGRVRSRKKEDVLSEVRDLAQKGYREFVMNGIHLCSYGRDLAMDETALGELLTSIAEVEGVERIRLGSLEPSCMTEDMILLLKNNPKLCPHFHLSLQSGSDSVLQRMNRKYDTGLFRNVVINLRKVFPDASFTTDMICGFPGETEEEHRESCSFAEEIGFTHIHVFPFSPREGTKAYAMKPQVDASVKNRRTAELRAISDKMEEARTKAMIGKRVEVLVEQVKEEGHFEGYSREYIRVEGICEDSKLLPGMIVEGKITDSNGFLACGGGFSIIK